MTFLKSPRKVLFTDIWFVGAFSRGKRPKMRCNIDFCNFRVKILCLRQHNFATKNDTDPIFFLPERYGSCTSFYKCRRVLSHILTPSPLIWLKFFGSKFRQATHPMFKPKKLMLNARPSAPAALRASKFFLSLSYYTIRNILEYTYTYT